jgi:uncharacterized phage protein (TIGR02218 family)
MKAASVSLINLLASNNQFAMWEEYAFNFPNLAFMRLSTRDDVDAVYGQPVGIVNVDAITNAGTNSSVGVTVSGLDPAIQYMLSLPAGQLYVALSEQNPPQWVTTFRVTDAFANTTTHGSITAYTTPDAARRAFPVSTITGSSSYTFWIQDTPVTDNSGGLSILLSALLPMTTTPPPTPGVGNLAAGPTLARGVIRNIVGVEVDTLDVKLGLGPDIIVANVPLGQFAIEGGFDGGRLTLTREFSASWASASCGSLNLFNGRVGPLTISAQEIAMQVKADLELLDIQMPRNLYMAPCIHTLYGPGCGLSSSAFTVTGNTTANSTTGVIQSNLSNPADYFSLGVMQYQSGQNNQAQRSVASYANGAVTVVPPFDFAPAPGDLFTIRPGCDKLVNTCDTKFGNKVNFRGYPFIPSPEASY